MARGLLKEIVIIVGATLFFLILCASVGVSKSRTPESLAEASGEQELPVQDLSPGNWVGRNGPFQ